MQIDKISFTDIAIFQPDDEYSVFHKLNFTRTEGGKNWLKVFYSHPLDDINKIRGTQNILRQLILHIDQWPEDISNGTMVVMNKFLDYSLDDIGSNPGMLSTFFYKFFHSADYRMVRFSMSHFYDFFRGMSAIANLLDNLELPSHIQIHINRIHSIFRQHESLQGLAEVRKEDTLPMHKHLYFAAAIRALKTTTLELMDIYYRLDAWYSMAIAVKKYNLAFPEFIDQDSPLIELQGLYHLLLSNPVPYDIKMNPQQNFLFLTGANMAGKSTLIKSIGAATFLAHIGMGVPAQQMKLTLFDGLISNVNVADNIVRGESFFFNEVQRIKNTIEKVNNGQKWLVLIDELFKGTNIQDAMKCSLAVIEGLLKIKNSLFVLSTHLYEIGEQLQHYETISFKHFETTVTEEDLFFTYQLNDGISKDRIGYLILKREKVVEMLKNIGQ